MSNKVLNLAHRGFKAKAPENTMIAYELAKKAGADGLELDVQKTRDGKLVVIHDETINRTTDGTGWIKDIEFSKLRQFDAGSWFDDSYKGERIPLLDEVLDWAKESGMFINIELKTTKVPYPGIENDIINLVREFRMEEQVLLSSFNHFSLRTINQIDPSFQIGVLYETPLVDPWIYAKRLGAIAIHPDYSLVNDELMEGCKENNVLVNPYTVNEMIDLKKMMNLRVNSIITNHPDRLTKLIKDEVTSL
jgi:glycerophosphoryl diester phosphodiesterase